MGNDRDYRKQVGINYHPMTNLTQNLSIPNFEILSLNVDFLGYIRSNVWMFL